MSAPVPQFSNDDDAAQHWLRLLRDGDPDQKVQAREQLAGIFERRGMFEEATDLLISNVHDGVRSADIFRWLARLYRNQGQEVLAMQAAGEAAKYIVPPPRISVDSATIVLPAQSTALAASQSEAPPRRGGVRCPECSYVNVQRRAFCKRCHEPLTGQQPVRDVAVAPYAQRYGDVAPAPSSFGPAPAKGGGSSRIAAMVLGVIGGIFGIFAALFAMSLGGIGGAFGMKDAGLIVNLGFAAMGFCLLGFLGAGIALPKPVMGGVILLISAIGFMISVSWFAIVTTPLFLLAALLAFMGRR